MIAKDLDKVVRKGELTKIENYDKAIADTTQTWICHHRLELTLDGEFAHLSKELIRMGMYYHRPYFELIFLTESEHKSIHGKEKKGMKFKEEHRKNLSKALTGRKLSEETRKKMSEARKGEKKPPRSTEHKKKISETLKGRKLSEETRNKISEISKNKPRSDFGKKYFAHFGYSQYENRKQYARESRWYHKHNHKCSWEKEE